MALRTRYYAPTPLQQLTRAANRISRSEAMQAIQRGARNAISMANRMSSARSANAKRTNTKKRILTKQNFNVGARGSRVKAKKRKLRYYEKKPKVNLRFKRNFTKLSNAEKECSKYTYIANMQLRQSILDKPSLQFYDEGNNSIRMGGPRDLLDAVSVCFGIKAASANYNVVTNNSDDDQKIHTVAGSIDFFFKSTSGHVVNIEMYECTWKKGVNQSLNIQTAITQSIASANLVYRNRGVGGTEQDGTYALSELGTKIEDIPDIWNYMTIKVHKFKLQPGDYTTKSIKVFGSKTIDLTKNQNNNTLDFFMQGTKEFFFRVLNDVTVSGDANNNKVHAFPSNLKGGVALRYQKNYKLLSPNTETEEKKLVVGNFCYISETIDQQVLYQNPSGSAAIDS